MAIAFCSTCYLSYDSALLHAEERGQGIVIEVTVTQSPESRRRRKVSAKIFKMTIASCSTSVIYPMVLRFFMQKSVDRGL
jgi:hypothetical protein